MVVLEHHYYENNWNNMKNWACSEAIHKDVVVIGNGPSGIALSYMLSGNVPFVTSNKHPDEFLSARLAPVVNQNLVDQDLGHLASGLEGRTTNPVSLLLDCLIHPCADIGFDMEPLVEWKKGGKKIDHIVLGKGPPGGSWHSMDPQILTLSLGTWMALPGLKYQQRDGSEKRASAQNVAAYYQRYVTEMDLSQNFRDNVVVTSIRPIVEDNKSRWVEKVNNDITQKGKHCTRPETRELKKKTCTLSNAFSYIMNGRLDKYYRRPREIKSSKSPEKKVLELLQDNRCLEERLYSSPMIRNGRRDRSISYSCESECERLRDLEQKHHQAINQRVPNKSRSCDLTVQESRWLVEAYDLKSRQRLVYTCDHLVLANGSSDLPNRLAISDDKTDPYWLLHDLRSLEIELDLHLQVNSQPEPVLIVGAGLSAADAVIAMRSRNVPVIHVFRNAGNVSKQLPENMYPEYHKVHQMMKEGSSYSNYTALPECNLENYDELAHTVTLASNEGKRHTIKVSFAAVLIGSRPDLGFLPENYNLTAKKSLPIDCKKNPVNINRLTHAVIGYEGLYALGPLAGDNFVRFLPGGALAILSDLYRKHGF